MLTIPQSLADSLRRFHGVVEHERILDVFQNSIPFYAKLWGLKPLKILEGGSSSCCVLCLDENDHAVVLKIPNSPIAGRSEQDALSYWAPSQRVPSIHHTDPVTGVFVMDYLTSTACLETSPSEAFGLLNKLHSLDDGPVLLGDYFLGLKQFFSHRFNLASSRTFHDRFFASENLIEEAKEIASQLLTLGDLTLVHGDFQNKNILASSQGLIAFDPLPVVAHRAWDYALWSVTSSPLPVAKTLKLAAKECSLDLDVLEKYAFVVAATELRPSRPDISERALSFLEGKTAQRV